MPRSSNSALRVVAILNFLGENPRQGFTLTEIMRGLGLNPATCHSLVNELVKAGYLYRTSAKTYMLGAALTRLGRVALIGTPIEIASQEVRLLATRYGAACYLLARERNEAVVLERAVSPALIDWPVPIGRRWSLRLAAGAPLVAWGDQDEIDAWFCSMEPEPSGAEVQRIREGIAFARASGFYVYMSPVEGAAGRSAEAASNLKFPAVEQQSALELDKAYELHSISAPVMAGERRVEFLLFLTGFTSPLRGEEIRRVGHDLKAACERVGDFFS